MAIIICAGVFLFASLYLKSFAASGPNAVYAIKNILQVSTLILTGIFSTLLYKNRKNCKPKL